MIKDRIRRVELQDRIMTADQAAALIKDNMIVATSGFTPSGYPKAIPLAMAKKAEKEPFGITLITGASVGDELDGALSRTGVLKGDFLIKPTQILEMALMMGLSCIKICI